MQRRWNGLEMVKCLVSDVCSRILVVLILNGALATSFAAVDKDQPIRVVTVPVSTNCARKDGSLRFYVGAKSK